MNGNKNVPRTSTLEINGKRYDAVSGRQLGVSSHSFHNTAKSVDGMVHHHPVVHPAIHRAAPHHATAHPVQHSQTLMRKAVRQPDGSFKRHMHSATHTGSLTRPVHFDIAPKYSVDEIDRARLKRASHIEKSEMIRRFSAATEMANQPMAIAKQPLPAMAPATPQPMSKQPSNDVFERALAAANSHKEPYHPVKRKRSHPVRKITGALASIVAVVAVAGFVAYQNAAAIQLRVASSRAGIQASLPAWQPSGFKLGSLSYGPGSVTVSYHSVASPRDFTITQTGSNWDSATLLNDFVYPNNQTYNTISSAGSTIYTYGNNDATWVNSGIWYKLVSHGALSTSQIVNIATSM